MYLTHKPSYNEPSAYPLTPTVDKWPLLLLTEKHIKCCLRG